MAVIKETAVLAEKGFLLLFDQASFRLRASHNNDMVWADDNGATVEIHGHGFKYSHGTVTDGIVTSATVTDSEGHLLLQMTHGNVEASRLPADLEHYGMLALNLTFATGGDDHVAGSKKGERLYGQEGNDVINGKAGDDFLNGDVGNDHLIGGSGVDTFLFTTGWGKDVIKDFDDSGKDQDLIELQFKSMYSHMDKYQHGDNVVLDFTDGDKLIIEHAMAGHITKSDFVFLAD
jgi:Ca2+-binding RTX toxin-like protein